MTTTNIPKILTSIALAVVCAQVVLGQGAADPLRDARAFLKNGQLEKSEASVREFLKLHANSADAHFLLGYVLFREKKAKESLAEFTAGAAVRRPNSDELKTVASDYVLLGDFADADRWFTEVTSASANDADAWYLLGRTKYNEGRFDEAASSFERALLLQPRYVSAESNLGLAWRELNKPDQAKAAFQTAIDWQGGVPSDPQPYLNLGTLLADQGEFEAAILNLSIAVDLSPENPKMREELGSAYEAANNLPKAQAELEHAVELAPNTSGPHFKLAEVYRKEGLRDRARQEFEICAKLNSTHSSSETPNPFVPKPETPH